MQEHPGVDELIRRTAEERLLDAPPAALPASLGRPPAAPAPLGRSPIVAAGVVMTGVTLIAGLAAVAWALIGSFTDGADLARGALFALGIVLVATHWGWVHVAELSARAVATRRHRDAAAHQRAWLAAIEPYPREDVVTEVEPDGSIAIVTRLFRPVPAAPGRFGFASEEVARERLSEETPAAIVAERVEEARRIAAVATAGAHERYAALAETAQARGLLSADEQALLEERRATARALSERLNAHLRDPPLDP